jgi:hypothetical protein
MQTLTASESLLTLPAEWILEPVQGKRPYRKNWTKSDLDRLSCLAELESGKATGLGLKLGNGLLAVEIDGVMVESNAFSRCRKRRGTASNIKKY